MDVELENVNFDDRWMNYYFNNELFMNVTKMPGRWWRIYMSEPTGEYVFRKDQQQAYQEVADKLGIGFKVGQVEWATAWQVRNHIANRYREKRLIICGDACHVHSPSGGQGMNCCMQDAWNLGWKLAAVYKGQAGESILDSYEKERKPVGEQVSNGAMATHDIVMGFGKPLDGRYALTQVPNWESKSIHLVSGLSHNYRDAVVQPQGIKPVSGPQPGERAPDALLVGMPKKRLYDIFRRPQFSLLVAPGQQDPNTVAETGLKTRDRLNARFPEQVSTFLISKEKDDRYDFDHQARDEGSEFTSRYSIPPEGRLILVRPDLYIGLACDPGQWKLIEKCLEQWFL